MILADIHTSSQALKSNVVAIKREHYLLRVCLQSILHTILWNCILSYFRNGVVQSSKRKLNEQIENYSELIDGKSSTPGLQGAPFCPHAANKKSSISSLKTPPAYHCRAAGGPLGLRLSQCTFDQGFMKRSLFSDPRRA